MVVFWMHDVGAGSGVWCAIRPHPGESISKESVSNADKKNRKRKKNLHGLKMCQMRLEPCCCCHGCSDMQWCHCGEGSSGGCSG